MINSHRIIRTGRNRRWKWGRIDMCGMCDHSTLAKHVFYWKLSNRYFVIDARVEYSRQNFKSDSHKQWYRVVMAAYCFLYQLSVQWIVGSVMFATTGHLNFNNCHFILCSWVAAAQLWEQHCSISDNIIVSTMCAPTIQPATDCYKNVASVCEARQILWLLLARQANHMTWLIHHHASLLLITITL